MIAAAARVLRCYPLDMPDEALEDTLGCFGILFWTDEEVLPRIRKVFGPTHYNTPEFLYFLPATYRKQHTTSTHHTPAIGNSTPVTTLSRPGICQNPGLRD